MEQTLTQQTQSYLLNPIDLTLYTQPYSLNLRDNPYKINHLGSTLQTQP